MNTTYCFVFSEMRISQVAWFGIWPLGSKLIPLGQDPRPFLAKLTATGWKQKASLDLSAIPGPELFIFEKSDVLAANVNAHWPG